MTNEIVVLTPEEAAVVLKCSRRAVYKYLLAGEMPGHKCMNKWLIDHNDLKAFIAGAWTPPTQEG